MFYLILFLIFSLGLLVGSFLNVIIYRLFAKKPIFWGRSHCPLCNHKLGAHELFPIISYILLKGKCKKCKKPISLQYPLVELATGILFVLGVLKLTNYSLSITDYLIYFQIISLLIIFSAFIIIFVFDLRYFLILNKLTYPLFFFSFVYLILESLRLEDSFDHFIFSLGAALFAFSFFLFLYLISKGKWMGGGDVKLSLSLGIFLGWPHILVTIFLTFLFGSIIGILLIIFSDKKLKSALPFGAIFVFVALVVFLSGDFLPNLYFRLLGF
jgi:prepilin signal peptidase PulO-like enzyme (type II secretory pathway)